MENNLSFDFGVHNHLTADTLKRFLVWTLKNDVSDVLLQGGGRIFIEKHGRQYPITSYAIDPLELESVIDQVFNPDVKTSLKMAKIVNTSLQLTGDLAGTLGLERNERARFRANFTQATVYETEAVMSLTMRVLKNQIPKLHTMGLPDVLVRSLFPASGLAFICGETGSGKSTLMASINQHSGETFPDRKVITGEDPIELILGGPDWIAPEPAQSEMGRDFGTYADFIAYSALRRSPKNIDIGELLERFAYEAALTAGKTGHFCKGTMHVDTCGDAIQRAVLMFPFDARESIAYDTLKVLRYIIVQRLLRSTDGKRVAVREYVIFDTKLRSHLLSIPYTQWGKTIDQLLLTQNRSLIQNAFQLYKDGIVSEEEMIEVAGYLDFLKLKEGTYAQESMA